MVLVCSAGVRGSALTVTRELFQDLTSVLNLQKKHALLENDVNAHSDRVEVARKQAQQFTEANHFDAPNIQAKTEALVQR